ncbi:MAG: malate synthase G, partial [Novosphingopyxis baekryungensis]|nr:malate synthase G [Novosphingopyxis baekryungensis]
MIERNGLKIDEQLVRFVEEKALPGSGIEANAFWGGLADLYANFAPRNRALLNTRADLQAKIDSWHQEHDVITEGSAYHAFLRDIGYLVAEPE